MPKKIEIEVQDEVNLEDIFESFSGFDLCGWKMPDGKIRLGANKDHGKIIDAWPDVVYVYGRGYTLENEKWQDNGFGWGQYV